MKLIKRVLSSYSFQYPTTLVYMLQASEYTIHDYIEWLGRISDFRRVIVRKKLVLTPKAKGLLAVVWLLVLTWLAALTLTIMAIPSPTNMCIIFASVILFPLVLPYLILAPLWLGQVLIQRPKERAALASASAILASHQGYKIAIAGSYGKTSMKHILETILSQKLNTAGPPHSYNTPLGIAKFVEGLKGHEDVLVFELGEYYPGDIRDLSNFVEPDLGVITGVNEAHLSRFKTLQATAAGIFELAEYKSGMPIFVNAESRLAHDYAVKHCSPVFYDVFGSDGWKVSGARTNLEGTTFVASKGSRRVNARTKLIGRHQIGPILAAIAIADSLGLSDNEIELGIAALKAFPHRMEVRVGGDNIPVIDDSYNGNPDGAKALIGFLAELKGCRRFYITPGFVEMGVRSAAVHHELGRELAEAKIEVVGLIRNSVTKDIAEGLEKAHYAGKILWFEDAESCFTDIHQHTKKGDVLAFQNDWPDNYA